MPTITPRSSKTPQFAESSAPSFSNSSLSSMVTISNPNSFSFLRTKKNKLTNPNFLVTTEKKDDLLNVDSDKFDSILSEFDKLHDQVKKPREQVADAEALLDLTRSLVGSVKSLVNEGVTPSQFVSSLIQRYAPSPNSSIDWQKLGTSVSSVFLTVHGSSTMLVCFFYLP